LTKLPAKIATSLYIFTLRAAAACYKALITHYCFYLLNSIRSPSLANKTSVQLIYSAFEKKSQALCAMINDQRSCPFSLI
jgi:hypothetical protein